MKVVGNCLSNRLHATRKLKGEGAEEPNIVQVSGNGAHHWVRAIDR